MNGDKKGEVSYIPYDFQYNTRHQNHLIPHKFNYFISIITCLKNFLLSIHWSETIAHSHRKSLFWKKNASSTPSVNGIFYCNRKRTQVSPSGIFHLCYKTSSHWCNLLSIWLRCGTKPYERGTQWDLNSLMYVC